MRRRCRALVSLVFAVLLLLLVMTAPDAVAAASPSPTPRVPPAPPGASTTSIRIFVGVLLLGSAFLLAWRRRGTVRTRERSRGTTPDGPSVKS